VPTADRAGALGDLVDDVVELRVLRLEELVQVVELRADDVPVVVAGFGVQDVLVGEQGVQDIGNGLTLVVGNADVDVHGVPPTLRCASRSGRFAPC
jgi:hypothetical protein